MPYPQSSQALARRLQKIADDRRESYQMVLTSFLIERALARMVSVKVLYEHLVFKGGYVGQRIFETGRFTRDLDSIILGTPVDSLLESVTTALRRDLGDHAWFEFEGRSELGLQNEYGGVRLKFRAGLLPRLRDLKRAQILHLDFGVGDPVTPAPVSASLEPTIGDDHISWRVYSVETICSEKLHTLVMRGSENSRSKDIFDLACLLPKADCQVIRTAILRTFEYRGDPVPESMAKVLRGIDTTLLRRGWKNALAGMRKIPDFDESFTVVVQCLDSHAV